MVITLYYPVSNTTTASTYTQVSPTAPVYLNQQACTYTATTITMLLTLPEVFIPERPSRKRIRKRKEKFKKDLTFCRPPIKRKLLPANKIFYCKVKKNKSMRSR